MPLCSLKMDVYSQYKLHKSADNIKPIYNFLQLSRHYKKTTSPFTEAWLIIQIQIKKNLKFGELSTVDFHQTEVELTIIWVTEHISEPDVGFRVGNSFFTQTLGFVIQPTLSRVRVTHLVQKVVDFKSRKSSIIHNIRGYRSIQIV